MKNAFFCDLETQFLLHMRHITSPLQSPAGYCYVKSEVPTAAIVNSAVLWDVAPCGSSYNCCFGGTYTFQLPGRKNQGATKFSNN
jgi:hypothetical protein